LVEKICNSPVNVNHPPKKLKTVGLAWVFILFLHSYQQGIPIFPMLPHFLGGWGSLGGGGDLH